LQCRSRGTAAAIFLLWGDLVHAADLVIALVTHRSFQTSKSIEYALAVLGTMSMQGPVIGWVADHRKHHAHADEAGDPHSPHVTREGGKPSVIGGPLARSHGLAVLRCRPGRLGRYAPELNEDRGMRIISHLFFQSCSSAPSSFPGWRVGW
jgi:stearoyl-CoA desaturase (delta-9 desaturase)